MTSQFISSISKIVRHPFPHLHCPKIMSSTHYGRKLGACLSISVRYGSRGDTLLLLQVLLPDQHQRISWIHSHLLVRKADFVNWFDVHSCRNSIPRSGSAPRQLLTWVWHDYNTFTSQAQAASRRCVQGSRQEWVLALASKPLTHKPLPWPPPKNCGKIAASVGQAGQFGPKMGRTAVLFPGIMAANSVGRFTPTCVGKQDRL